MVTTILVTFLALGVKPKNLFQQVLKQIVNLSCYFVVHEGMEKFTEKTKIKLDTNDLLLFLPESCDFPMNVASNSERITALQVSCIFFTV